MMLYSLNETRVDMEPISVLFSSLCKSNQSYHILQSCLLLDMGHAHLFQIQVSHHVEKLLHEGAESFLDLAVHLWKVLVGYLLAIGGVIFLDRGH
jgi:hypothetical protein